jgi:hypothetical protein
MALRGGPLEQWFCSRTLPQAGPDVGASVFGYFFRDWKK